jgi:hypothetical protein
MSKELELIMLKSIKYKKQEEQCMAKEFELAKKLAVLGRIYRMSLLSEDEYKVVKKKIMREYNVVSFMNT